MWPLLSVAMDRGSDGLAACACLQRAKLGNVEGAARPRMWRFQRCHPGAAAHRGVGTFGVDAGGMDACTGGSAPACGALARVRVEPTQQAATQARAGKRAPQQTTAPHTPHNFSAKGCSAAQPDASTLRPRPRLRVRGTLRQVGGTTKTGKHLALSVSDPLASSCAGTGSAWVMPDCRPDHFEQHENCQQRGACVVQVMSCLLYTSPSPRD